MQRGGLPAFCSAGFLFSLGILFSWARSSPQSAFVLAVDAIVDRSKVKAVVVGGRVGGARDLPPLICLAGAGRAFGLGAWIGVVGCCDDDDTCVGRGAAGTTCWLQNVSAEGMVCPRFSRLAFRLLTFFFSAGPILSRRVRSCWRWMLLWIAVK